MWRGIPQRGSASRVEAFPRSLSTGSHQSEAPSRLGTRCVQPGSPSLEPPTQQVPVGRLSLCAALLTLCVLCSLASIAAHSAHSAPSTALAPLARENAAARDYRGPPGMLLAHLRCRQTAVRFFGQGFEAATASKRARAEKRIVRKRMPLPECGALYTTQSSPVFRTLLLAIARDCEPRACLPSPPRNLAFRYQRTNAAPLRSTLFCAALSLADDIA